MYPLLRTVLGVEQELRNKKKQNQISWKEIHRLETCSFEAGVKFKDYLHIGPSKNQWSACVDVTGGSVRKKGH